MERVTPRLFRGLRDLLPQEMGARQWLIDVIRGVYERYGFVPLSTPAIEYLEALAGTGGEEANESIFRVRNPDDRRDTEAGERLGLRFDLTVPLARVVAQYRDLPRPFRRYQVAPVWRADKPDRGRFREFIQFDLDSVGVQSELADVEIIAAMADTLEALKVGPYQVRFSSRRVLNLLLAYAQVPATIVVGAGPEARGVAPVERPAVDVFRVLDKLPKIGAEKVRLELTTGYRDESGDRIAGLGLSGEQVRRIEQFVAISAPRRDEVIGQVRDLFREVPGASAEIDVLTSMSRHLQNLGYGDDRVVLDLSVARGLAYYTGPVFEAVLLDAPQFGSVFGGGRYDDLVLRFSGERIPATGASIGVDRLLAALIHLERAPIRRPAAQVLVTRIDASLEDEYVKMAFELRRAGIAAELYLGAESRMGKQLKYADECGIPLAILYGSDEHKHAGGPVVTIKDLLAGQAASKSVSDRGEHLKITREKQSVVPRSSLVTRVTELIGKQTP